MKKLWLSICSTLLLVGCTASNTPTVEPTTEPTVEPTVEPMVEPTADTEVLFSDLYPGVSEDNAFIMTDRDSLVRMIEHGTGIVFLGFPECPWCQYYIPVFDEIAQSYDVNVLYYNIYVDKTEDREFYDQIAGLIDERNSDILAFDNDGRYRIFMPLVLFIDGGEIIGFDNETSTEDSSVISPEEYWTEEKLSALKDKLDGLTEQIALKQAENDSQGCDDACSALE